MRLPRHAPWLFVPAAIALGFLRVPATVVFVVSCLAMLALAAAIGHATSDLARRMGPASGRLFNATFGNGAGLILAVLAVEKGLSTVVKASARRLPCSALAADA